MLRKHTEKNQIKIKKKNNTTISSSAKAVASTFATSQRESKSKIK